MVKVGDRGPEHVSTTSMIGALMEVHSVCPRRASLSSELHTLTRRSISKVMISDILSHSAARRPTLTESSIAREVCYATTTLINWVGACDAFHARDEHASVTASN